MGDHTAFFYGTLMAPGVLHRVIHGTHSPEPWQQSQIDVRPGLLRAYRRHRVRHADYPAIQPCADAEACVRGSIVSGLTDGDLFRLDIFEGNQYSRRKVRVQVLKDVELDEAAQEGKTEVLEEVEAQTYVWEDDAAALELLEWDFAVFKRDKMKAWMGVAEADGVDVDEGFADVDRAVAAQTAAAKPDPMGGRGANGHITRQLNDVVV